MTTATATKKKLPSETTEEKVPRRALNFAHCAVEFAEKEEGARPKFFMLANSGAIIKNHWWWGNLAIDLDGMKIGRQKKPALLDHNPNKRVGWTNSIKKTDKGLEVEGTFLKSSVHGQEVMKEAKEGFPWQASVQVVKAAQMLNSLPKLALKLSRWLMWSMREN